MNPFFTRIRQWLGHTPAAGVVGVAVASAWLAAVLTLFGAASSDPWLADTPENHARAGHCQQQPGRAERSGCMQQLQLAARGGERDGQRDTQLVAQAASSADAAR